MKNILDYWKLRRKHNALKILYEDLYQQYELLEDEKIILNESIKNFKSEIRQLKKTIKELKK